MNYYKHNENIILTELNLENHFKTIDKKSVLNHNGYAFYVGEKGLRTSRSSFVVNFPWEISHKENLYLLDKNYGANCNLSEFPSEFLAFIKNKKIFYVNAKNPNWLTNINHCFPQKWKVHIVGLGDVGGTLITGLRLLGGDCISSIGIYDKDKNKVKRWLLEGNQILDINNLNMPEIKEIEEKEIFHCDMFVFCVSLGVPQVGKESSDVRLAQFEGNSKVVTYYAKLARKANFKGIFAVVSDPVDLLCKVAFNESNKNSKGDYDFNGLSSSQIRGYGLGVMNARASYFAKQDEKTKAYIDEGRAFGPHGEGLIIANSIEHYDEYLSDHLTEKTKKANLEVRTAGFKPYIAPALSSGALSLLSTIRGQWHYSCNFIDGTYIGCKNRFVNGYTELETYNMPERLMEKLQQTKSYLDSIYF